MYDPVIGRFISPDNVIPDQYNPQSLNRYSYCLNNPLHYTDPSGHFYTDEYMLPEIVCHAYGGYDPFRDPLFLWNANLWGLLAGPLLYGNTNTAYYAGSKSNQQSADEIAARKIAKEEHTEAEWQDIVVTSFNELKNNTAFTALIDGLDITVQVDMSDTGDSRLHTENDGSYTIFLAPYQTKGSYPITTNDRWFLNHPGIKNYGTTFERIIVHEIYHIIIGGQEYEGQVIDATNDFMAKYYYEPPRDPSSKTEY